MEAIVTDLIGEQTENGDRIRLLFKRNDEVWAYIQSTEPGKPLQLKKLRDVVFKPLIQGHYCLSHNTLNTGIDVSK